MNKFSKVIAVALAATMVFGSSLTAFAGDNDGSSTGAGTAEGHVEKKATSVVLPTVPTDGEDTVSPFRYTMDPEGLIAATTHAKYGSAVEFPSTGDTSVYFNNGKKGGDGTDKDNIVYANTSAAQKVINKSSHAIDLTVTATVGTTTADTDIPLVGKTAYASAANPSLYLGLIVGEEDAVAISTTTAATQTVTIEGTEDNFKIAVKSDNSGYEYRVLTLDEYKAIDGNSSKTQADFDATWEDVEFQLEGGVTTGKSITSTTTAPAVTVTWSWVDPTAGPSVTFAENTITVSGLADDQTVSAVSLSYGTNTFNIYSNPNVNWNDSHTVGELNEAWQEELAEKGTVTVKVTLNDDSEYTATASYE